MGDAPTDLQYPCDGSPPALPIIPLMFTGIKDICNEKCALSRDYRITGSLVAASTAGSLVIRPSPGLPDEVAQVVSYNGCKYSFIQAEVFCPGVTRFRLSNGEIKPAPAEILLTHQQGGGGKCTDGNPLLLTICVPLGAAPAAGGRYTTRDLNAVLSQIVQLNPQPPQKQDPAQCTGDYGTSGTSPCPYQAATCDSTKKCGGGAAPNVFVGGGSVVVVNVPDFSFNQAVPTAPYCTYVQSTWPYPVSSLTGSSADSTAEVGCVTDSTYSRQVVVVQPTHVDAAGSIASQITLTPDTLSALGNLITTPPGTDTGSSGPPTTVTVAKKGDDLMAISKGPQTADDIYIDCQPTGSDGEELVEFSSPALGVAQWGESFVNFVTNNAIFGALFGGIVMWVLMKLVKKFFRRLGATKALVADADSEDGQADLASTKQVKARAKGSRGRMRLVKRGSAGQSASEWAGRKKAALKDRFEIAKGADRKQVRTERLKQNMREDAARMAQSRT